MPLDDIRRRRPIGGNPDRAPIKRCRICKIALTGHERDFGVCTECVAETSRGSAGRDIRGPGYFNG